MPSIKCGKCGGDGFVRHHIAGTYCDTYKATCERCFGCGEHNVAISSRGHLREMWKIHKLLMINDLKDAKLRCNLPSLFWREELKWWMRKEGRNEHAMFIHDYS